MSVLKYKNPETGKFESMVKLVDVVDNLSSNDSGSALSANQGRILNEKITNISPDAIKDVDELPEITEENKNDIIRYKNCLYATGVGYTNVSLREFNEGQIEFDLVLQPGEVAYFDFSRLPAFLESICFLQYRIDQSPWWSRDFIPAGNPPVLCSYSYVPPGETEPYKLEVVLADGGGFDVIIGETTARDYEYVSPIACYSHDRGIIENALVFNNNATSSYAMRTRTSWYV